MCISLGEIPLIILQLCVISYCQTFNSKIDYL